MKICLITHSWVSKLNTTCSVKVASVPVNPITLRAAKTAVPNAIGFKPYCQTCLKQASKGWAKTACFRASACLIQVNLYRKCYFGIWNWGFCLSSTEYTFKLMSSQTRNAMTRLHNWSEHVLFADVLRYLCKNNACGFFLQLFSVNEFHYLYQ